ncbi:MAG: hypothetical protein AAFO69_16685, partial [Bacteroidota bacterium]
MHHKNIEGNIFDAGRLLSLRDSNDLSEVDKCTTHFSMGSTLLQSSIYRAKCFPLPLIVQPFLR